MRYQITGKQIDIGEALQTHVQNELGGMVGKYAGRPTDANIVFSRSAHEYVCEATVHLSTGLTAQAKAHATEIYAAFDACLEKMEKQLRRYKRRLKDHHKDRSEPVELFGASSYILASEDQADDSEPESLQPIIVAEMETKIASLSVGEAVMQMELAGAPVLIFRNEGKDGINVVYRRAFDGARAEQSTMELSSILAPGAVKVFASASSKKRLFQNLAELAETAYGMEAQPTVDALLDRESLGPTGVGHGVALPHARLNTLDRVVGAFIVLEKPLEFGAVDRQPVDIAFGLFAPEKAGVEHLKALALVSRTLRESSVLTKLRANPDSATLYTILTENQSVQAA